MADALRRWGRDFRVSRATAIAIAVAAGMAALASFSVGWRMGEAAERARGGDPVALTAGAADREVVDLLGRIEAGRATDDGASSLSYPTALRGGASGDAGPIGLAAEDPTREQVPPGPAPDVSGDPPPAARFAWEAGRFPASSSSGALRDHLRAAGLSAASVLELRQGERTWRVLVAWGDDRAAVDAQRTVVEDALASANVETGVPVLVELGS